MDIYLLQYNNYFNRIVKKENSLRDYVKNSTNYDVLSSTNFNLNDGVVTSHVFNWCNEWNPDYIIVASEDNIKHRWFVIEWVKRCKGQFTAKLRRDVIVDNFETVINAPIFVQKAHLQDNDPMIFNPEGQSYNQIKTSETIIGNGKCAWAIIYCAKNDALDSDINISASTDNYDIVEIGSTFENWEYYQYIENTGKVIDNKTMNYGIRYKRHGIKNANEFLASNPKEFWYFFANLDSPLNLNIYDDQITFGNHAGKYIDEDKDNFYSHATTFLENTSNHFISLNKYKKFLKNFNGKTIKTSDDKYYKILIKNVGTETWTQNITNLSGTIYNDFNTVIDKLKLDGTLTGDPNNNSFYIASSVTTCFRVIPEIVTDYTAKFKLSNIHKYTEASAYKIFCIPFPIDKIRVNASPFIQFDMTNKTALNMCTSLISTSGITCYDVQILPYCPFDNRFNSNGELYLGATILDTGEVIPAFDSNYCTFAVDNDSNKYGIVFSLKTSKYESTIIKSITNNEELKIQNECNRYRLVSPNYAGEFEFSLAKVGGNIDYFTISCDYKPYQPLIIVQPHFQYLYGQNFNDARGLILSGDFSVPSYTDEWKQYQINNKNYEQAFNRQIEHMDYVNKVSEVGDVAGAIAGTFSGAIAGATTGAIAGGPVGAVVGGIAGAGTSAVGGAVDVAMSKALRAENKDYAIDNYNYQLGNIKARPYTINKLGCLNNNFKFFPFVEYYTCTDKEKEALRNKIKYSGMTVNRIGTISEFIDSNEKHFIKGQFIRLEELGDDYHMATVICEELMKGEFI